jgi:UDP-3-O-[3-hydroxymyristoyl] glucosamine N-acyltransferase
MGSNKVELYNISFVRIFAPTVIINIENFEFFKHVIIDSFVLIKKFAIIGANGVILPEIKIGEGGALVQYGMTRDDLYLIFEKCSILTRKYFYPLFST